MNSRLIYFSLLVVASTVLVPASSSGDDRLSPQQLNWFENNIRPILATKCYSCHAAKDNKAEGGLTLDSRAGWSKGGDRGPAIVPKDVDGSLLIRAVRYKDSDMEMPPDKKLTDKQIKLLEQWVEAGAPDPRSSVVVNKSGNPADPVAGKSHWAFKPLANIQTPRRITDPDWSNSPIDDFVFQKLKQNNLRPNRRADLRTLGQRLSILLVGLPLNKTELDQLATDSADDAYQKLVERLLGSPQFGETWGRHWLDLARYADSNGLDENFLFREAWRYRNWVINAINNDQPFDQFTREQVAGDLLESDSISMRDRQRIGAGFLVVGPKVLLGVNAELQKMDVADELINTVGTTFLGQTLGCARCHDHKFDPIPTKDYYAMAGVFTSTEVMQTRYMLGQQRKMERLFGLGENENKLNADYEKYWRERGQLKKKLDQSKKVLDLLKKKDSDLVDLLKKNSSAISAELKKKLEQLMASGKKKFSDLSAPDLKPEEKGLVDQKSAIALQEKTVRDFEKQYTQPPPIPPRAMIPVDKAKPGDESIRVSGQFNRKGNSVPRGFLQVLSQQQNKIPGNKSGRLELANWLTDTKNGAGHLTARVLANRIWHHLIGKGIVRTTDNFGRTGEAPSHPELLDFLARELIESNWSIKHVVRLIVQSQTFQQSSELNQTASQIDPENRLLWRANRRRLTAEAFRDRMLMVSGQLDQRPLKSSVNYLGDQATAVGANKNRRRTNFPNRSVYLPVIRNDLPEIFEAFDYANAHRPTGSRPETTVATTGLYVLNDPLMLKTSRSLAEWIQSRPGVTDRERIQLMFETILGQECDKNEIPLFLNYVSNMEKLATKEIERQGTDNSKSENKKTTETKQDRTKEAKLRAWATACHAIFASSRFQIME